MHGWRWVNAARVVAFTGFLSTGCDIVQGFQNASEAVFPTEKTYLDAPGYRIASGGFSSLEFAGGTDLYLVARSSESKDDSLYSMLYGDPKPCILPNVRGHVVGDGTVKGPAMIAYFEDDQLPGTLHFADATCHVYDFTVENAWPPYAQLPDGFLMVAGADLILANPFTSTTRTLVTSIDNVFFNATSDTTFVLSDGRLVALGSDWMPGSSFGQGLVAAARGGGSFFIEDIAGIHRLTSSGGPSPMITDTLIAADGCNLGATYGIGASETWLAYYSPCTEKKLVVYGAGASKESDLGGLAADPNYIALLPVWPKTDGDPAVDPFFVFFLTDIDPRTGLGTLALRTPDGQRQEIGKSAAFERLTVLASEAGTFGYALVDVQSNLGRFVRWHLDAPIEELGTGVVRGMGDLLVHYDGRSGDFALPTSGDLLTVAHGVFPGRFKFRDAKNRWTALLSEFDGATASLSITESLLDFSEAVHGPIAVPVLQPIARNVVVDWRTEFISSVPGIAYLADFDADRGIGRLDYRNLQLGFTATVSDGVSMYLSTSDGLIYSVPYGASAGIWAVRAR
jgi:hypothetical protein